MNASLVVTGTGIKSVSHLTTEAVTYIKQADLVLYSVNEPLMADWIKRNSRHATSLDEVTPATIQRIDKYAAITQHIVQAVKQHQHVCVVFYGHPTVFAKSALDAVHELKQEAILRSFCRDFC